MYLDASAPVKLIVSEPETAQLRAYLRARPRRLVSRVGEVEVARVVARTTGATAVPVLAAFEGLDVIELTAEIARSAGSVGPSALRSLDAIHVASALAARDLDGFVTYDRRLAEAAANAGLRVVSPS